MNSKFNVKNLKAIKHVDGDLIKGLSSNFEQYDSFGESYYSYVNLGKKKAWRLHTILTNNMVVLLGRLNVNIFQGLKQADSIILDSKIPRLLTIYPDTWYGFEAIGSSDVLIHNITNMPYDENEVRRCELSTFEGIWYK